MHVSPEDWGATEKSHYGCFNEDSSGVEEFATTVTASTDLVSTVELLKGLFSPGFSKKFLRSVAEENLKLPRDHASELLRDTAFGDWRDIIMRIELPTLVVEGEGSMFSGTSQRWIASQIPGSELEVFTEAAGGATSYFLKTLTY